MSVGSENSGRDVASATAEVISHIAELFDQAGTPLAEDALVTERMRRLVLTILESANAGDFDGPDKQMIIRKVLSDLWNPDEITLLSLGGEADFMQRIMEADEPFSGEFLTEEMLACLFPEEPPATEPLEPPPVEEPPEEEPPEEEPPEEESAAEPPEEPPAQPEAEEELPPEEDAEEAVDEPPPPPERELPSFDQFLDIESHAAELSILISNEVAKYLKGHLECDLRIQPLQFEAGKDHLRATIIDLIDQHRRLSEVSDQLTDAILRMVPEKWGSALIEDNLPTELGNLARDLATYAKNSDALIEMQKWVVTHQADLPAVIFTYRTTEAKRKRLPDQIDTINALAQRSVERRMHERQNKAEQQIGLVEHGIDPHQKAEAVKVKPGELHQNLYKKRPISKFTVIGIALFVVFLAITMVFLHNNRKPPAYEFKLISEQSKGPKLPENPTWYDLKKFDEEKKKFEEEQKKKERPIVREENTIKPIKRIKRVEE